jgi:hypothetical protein
VAHDQSAHAGVARFSSGSGTGSRASRADTGQVALAVPKSGDEAAGIPAMPRLGVQRRDDASLALLRAWITSLGEE